MIHDDDNNSNKNYNDNCNNNNNNNNGWTNFFLGARLFGRAKNGRLKP